MPRAARDKKTGLTPKEEAFCLAYVANGGNASAAYRAAYNARGKQKTANEAASRLLNSGNIAARLAVLRASVTSKAMERAVVDRAYVLNSLQEVAERCMQSRPVLGAFGMPVMVETKKGDLAAAYTFNSNGANRALELMGKEIGMFVEREEKGKPGEFDDLKKKDEAELEAEAKELLAAGVKAGVIKVLPRKQQKAA